MALNPNYVQPEGIVASFYTPALVAAATNSINFTPPSAIGVYRLTPYVNVTAWTTPASFNAVMTFKDDAGTARTFNALLVGISHAESQAITAVDFWIGRPHIFRVDNSGTAITLSTSGTFTGSPVYNWGAILERLL